jgi:hypothetical protein
MYMFQPPDPRIPAVAFTPRKTKPSVAGLTVLAGILFAVVRFSISVVFILGIAPSGMEGVVETAWYGSIAASFGSGLVGAVMFWRLQGQKSTKFQGATAGIMAAFGSYAGIVLCVAVIAIVISDWYEAAAFGALVTGLVCGAGSVMITGIVTFPVLAILGMVLSSMQRASILDDDTTERSK